MINTQLKYTFAKVLKFIVIIFIIDFGLGFIAKELFLSQETGKFARSTYAITKAKENILIFGSSHAHRHYVPEVIEKKTGKTCYNAGADGQQLVYHSALQGMIFKRTLPELIILNIDENFLFKSEKAFDRLDDLNPYYDDYSNELDPVFNLKSKYADPKLFFKAYQNNSTLIQAVRYYLAPQETPQGYRPLFEKMTFDKLTSHREDIQEKEYTEEIDSVFVKTLENFINEAKTNNVKLVFVTSPNLIPRNVSKNKSLTEIKAIAKSKNIPFYNYLNSKDFANKLDLFYDPSHLNDNGARLFTGLLIDSILNDNKKHFN
ncbi:hypothetical protein [Flavivirga rizhaonensis]|uniref:DUF1574 domain-containing protein n=1 Tax=Flavivirga rizhaonensis TaxID=2559571 RepID=A0A4S1E0U8_9FLAO|nr:hypothetical protein [Flavivirga rizhaonensis]TGV03933.1 hypothetical protein EM932_03835 [Flavivirga rizhaonensis]